MKTIDSGKIDLIDYFHDPERNPEYCNPDDRGIRAYNSMLRGCTGIRNVYSLFSGIDSEEIMWVDYCCGKGVAVRSGTKAFNQKGGKVVSSLGVDIRRFEGLRYVNRPEFVHGQAMFFQHDMDEGVVEELRPDFVTCIKGLLYTKDPLKGIEGIFRQLNDGGSMLVTLSGCEVDYGSRHLVRHIYDELVGREDVTSHFSNYDGEFLVFLNKLKGGAKELDFGLQCKHSERGGRGWNRCDYVRREQ